MARARLSRASKTPLAQQTGEFVEPFIDFASEGDAVMLLKSLAAGAGFDQDTRDSISGWFAQQVNEERERFASSAPDSFIDLIQHGAANAPLQLDNVGTMGKAFMATAAGIATASAARQAANALAERSETFEKGLDTVLNFAGNQGDLNRTAQEFRNVQVAARRETFQMLNITKQSLKNEIEILHNGILELTGELDGEFAPQGTEKKITDRVVARKRNEIVGLQHLAEGVDVNVNRSAVRSIVAEKLTPEQRVRAKIVDLMDDLLDVQISMDDIKRRGLVTQYVDDILRRAKFVGKFALKAGGPAAVFLGGRAFRDEMKMLLEQKRRQLDGLEPAGVAGDSVGP